MAFEFKSPEEIDVAMKGQIHQYHNRGKGKGSGNTWPEELKELRRMVVYDYLRQGLSFRRIQEELMARWECSASAARSYYIEALNELAIENKEVIDEARKVTIERLTGIIEQAYERGQFDTALRAQDQLNKINALYTDKKEVEITGLQFDFGERE